MIISASYKTDIPAFYGTWFLNRLRAGYCVVVNPYDRRKAYRLSLRRTTVDGFVFWTKNVGPFVEKLEIVKAMGYPFILQFTINGYPRELEFSVTNPTRSVRQFQDVAARYGQAAAVWRYDPVILTSLTTKAFHTENFGNLCRELRGSTSEVIVSFAQIYKKTKRNMDWASREFGFEWFDPEQPQKRELLRELRHIAQEHGINLTVCAQPDLAAGLAPESHCVDASRLARIAGTQILAKLKGARPECGCFESRDIGDYDTCPHGCVYCYAVRGRKLAQLRYREHDPSSETLFPATGLAVTDFSTQAVMQF